MNDEITYDVVIAGGGLAGLSLSILLAREGYSVALFEKEKFPFHKVCGEYISLESYDFIEKLGVPLRNMNLPLIKKLIVSSPSGKKINSDLDLGGFGISRFLLDDELCKIARTVGVKVYEQARVKDITLDSNIFSIHSNAGVIKGLVVAGTFGKRSNLDIKFSRDFIKQKQGKLNNYIGVKYHIQYNADAETIALHNFENGYCGISKIEDGKYCLCYLTTAKNLRANNNSIPLLEKNVLQKNPFLKEIFTHATFLYAAPLTISQISFSKKTQVENNVLLIGDAAGMITPLCGNGMSMALHGAKLAFGSIDKFLKKEITRGQMEQEYIHQWNSHFKNRLHAGRTIQTFFGKSWLTNFFIRSISPFPFITKFLIRSTHGKPF